MQVIVIGLPRRADRRAAIGAALERVPRAQALFAADLGLVVDWRQWGDDDLDALRARAFPWCLPHTHIDWWNRHLKLGEIACTLSHWNVWTYGRTHCPRGVVVIEDDAILDPGFEGVDLLLAGLDDVDPAWDLLYLGRARVQPDRGRVGRFVVPGFSYCTHGYAVSPRGLTKLLATALDRDIIPVDEFLNAMFLDHPRSDLRARFPAVLAAYALDEDLVQRPPKERAESDTEASPFLTSDADACSLPRDSG